MDDHFISSTLLHGPAQVWAAGANLRAGLYRTGLLRQRRLRAPVISIGNLSWGGTGKTPVTIWLADRLRARGANVSILTRGYRRRSRERVKVLPPGTSQAEARDDGDEVQLYLRHGNAPIGICASRCDAGKMIERSFPVDVHLLDDGFQHLPLARDLDIVLLDVFAMTRTGLPSAGLSSMGLSTMGLSTMLREPLSALRRAHAVLLTRCELAETFGFGGSIENVEREVHRNNPSARCLRVETILLAFRNHHTGESASAASLRESRALAFCGLGNPENFFGSLSAAGVELLDKVAFPDHHRYNADGLRRLEQQAKGRGAACMITTEKDLVNFPDDASFSMPLYWPEIEPRVPDETSFIDWIATKVSLPSPKNQHTAGIVRDQPCQA
jgi:tetraacyldisaccharide 4'-kinase